MGGFTKLVPEIIQSSIWNEPSDIRIVWITLLAVKDENGYVQGDSQTISRLANVSKESAEKALDLFQKPDKNSHTPDDEGRRIAPVAGGWLVLNHAKYRVRDHKEEHAEYVRKWRKTREITKCESQVNHPSASVSASASEEDKSMREGETRRFIPPKPEEVEAYSASIGYPLNGAAWCDSYAQKGWMVGKSKMKDWKAAVRNWKTNGWKPNGGLAPKRKSMPEFSPEMIG